MYLLWRSTECRKDGRYLGTSAGIRGKVDARKRMIADGDVLPPW